MPSQAAGRPSERPAPWEHACPPWRLVRRKLSDLKIPGFTTEATESTETERHAKRQGSAGPLPSESSVTSVATGRSRGDDDIESLAASVAQHGLLVPVLIEPNGTVRGGVRRLAALGALGREEVECLIMPPGTDPELAHLVENMQRKDLSPVEEARAFRHVLDRTGWRQVRLARELGISEARVSLALNLLDAPSEVLASVERHEQSAYDVECAFSKAGRRDGRAEEMTRRAEEIKRRVHSGDVVPARFSATGVRVPTRRLPEGIRARAFTDRVEIAFTTTEEELPLAELDRAGGLAAALKTALGASEGQVIAALREARSKALYLDGETEQPAEQGD